MTYGQWGQLYQVDHCPHTPRRPGSPPPTGRPSRRERTQNAPQEDQPRTKQEALPQNRRSDSQEEHADRTHAGRNPALAMPCVKPIRGWRGKAVTANGKRPIVFDRAQAWAPEADKMIPVPCGQCIACRLDRTRQWAIRCMHEASLHDQNSFITLTYNDEHLPKDFSLDKRHWQLFMKKLRNYYPDEKIRYYHAGEYGTQTGRPHYHALLFNFQFPDLLLFKTENGVNTYTSQILEAIWGKGQTLVGEVTFESAAYVAGYCIDKKTGDQTDAYLAEDLETGETYKLEPPYSTMSRGGSKEDNLGGIGKGWYDKYKDDCYPSDYIVIKGKRMQPPRYYENLFEREDPSALRKIKTKRRTAAQKHSLDTQKLAARAEILRARNQNKQRKKI